MGLGSGAGAGVGLGLGFRVGSKCSPRRTTDAIASKRARIIDQPAHRTGRGWRIMYTSGRGLISTSRSSCLRASPSFASTCTRKTFVSFAPASSSAPGRCSAITLRLMVSQPYGRLAMMKYTKCTTPPAASASGNGCSGSMISSGSAL